MDLSEERQIKHQRVAAYLERAGLDGVLLGRRCNFSWYTCGGRNYVGTACDVGSSWLLVAKDSSAVIANNIEAARLKAEDLGVAGIELVEYDWCDPAGQSSAFAEATRGMALAADAPAPVAEARLLSRRFDELRWPLTESEIDRYRSVCDDAVAAVELAARSAEPGWTENQLAARVAEQLMRSDLVPWLLLAGADERLERFRHPLPTEMPMRRLAMVATCGERGGLIASVSRMVAFGAVPAELADKHAAAAQVAAALVGATRPGAKLGEIFAEAVTAYAAAGWEGQWRLHHQGGSCGYQGRDVKASPQDATVALADQAFAWNPSVAGAKIEQMILCREAGPGPLAQPTDWPAIEGRWSGCSINCADILAV